MDKNKLLKAIAYAGLGVIGGIIFFLFIVFIGVVCPILLTILIISAMFAVLVAFIYVILD